MYGTTYIQAVRSTQMPKMQMMVGISDLPVPLIAPERSSIAMYEMYQGTMQTIIACPMSSTAASVVKRRSINAHRNK